jgi:esterase FrsA
MTTPETTAASVVLSATPTGARERSLDEVKAEIMRRAGRINPFEGISRDGAAQIVNSLTSLDRDHWAQTWCKVGLQYEVEGDERARQGARGVELAEIYTTAFDYCRIGRYPVANTPGKREAYRHSVRMFRKAAEHIDPPLQIVEIPFGDDKLVGYLQVPRDLVRPPAVMHWGGVDGWKEDRLRHSATLHSAGLATLTIDMPGTGESPVLYGAPDAERTYSAWIDHLAQRADLDGSRIALWGGSFGAYWAARMAYVERKRLKGAVFHGGNVHHGFQREWLLPAFTTGGATYLFGAANLLEARGQALGTKTLEEFLSAAPALSLKALGLLDQPSAPILGVNGKLDDQAPVQDIYLLMEHGSPKEARIYPQGRHMGRTRDRPEQEIWDMIAAWLKDKLMR